MNVLIIQADALRADHLGCYGYSKDTSPQIDRLAQEGTRFENCVAVSTHTLPPVVSILTGQCVARHRLVTAQDYGKWILDDTWQNRKVALHLLAENGILVDGEFVMRWRPLGFTRDENDFLAYLEEAGSDSWFYFASPYPTHLPYDPPQDYYDKFIDRDFQPGKGTLERMEIVRTRMLCHPPGVVSAMEVGQKDAIGDEDEAHVRSVATVELQPEDEPGIRALYDGEVRSFDNWVGQCCSKLEELGILDETLIILLSDHGEELLERGHVGHSSCNLMGTLYEECLRVPLIIRYPRKVPSGKVVREVVSQIDVLPTIFELLGLDLPLPVDGKSLLPLIRGDQSFEWEEMAFAEVPPAGWQRLESDQRRIRCLRTAKWKLIQNVDPEVGTTNCELYNLVSDPDERENLVDKEPARLKELKDRLEETVGTRSRGLSVSSWPT